MMEEMRFKEIIKPMKYVFFDPDPEYLEILFDMFKRTESFIFKDAVNILIAQQETKRYPLPAEFRKAIKEAKDDRSRASVVPSLIDLGGDFYCNKCANSGIKLIEKFDSFYNEKRLVAVPCDCAEGKKVADGWRQYDEDKRQRRKKK